MPAHKFSFAIAAVLGIAPETSQALLEITNAQERLDTLLQMLNEIEPDIGRPAGNH